MMPAMYEVVFWPVSILIVVTLLYLFARVANDTGLLVYAHTYTSLASYPKLERDHKAVPPGG